MLSCKKNDMENRMTRRTKPNTYFDFGYGMVAAHRHPNGGGWVADTASVEDGVYVGPNALVYEHAKIHGNVLFSQNRYIVVYPKISDNSRVHGNAVVYGNSRISDDAEVAGNSRVAGQDIWIRGNTKLFDT